MERMTRDDLTVAYAAGQRDFREVDLRGVDLRGADLLGVDLVGADLRGADLRRADLHRALLRGANLRGAQLDNALLWAACLSGADLRCALLRSAYLQGVDLRGADLRDAYLRNIDLRGAGLRDTDPSIGLRWRWGRLSDDLTRDMMRYDAAQLPDGDALMSAWASGGPCPYTAMDAREIVVPPPLGMAPVPSLWSPGPAPTLAQLWRRLADERGFRI